MPDQQPGVEDDEVDRSALQRGDVLQVAAQRAAGELLHLDLAAALLRDELGELGDALPLRVLLAVLVRELERAILDVLRERAARLHYEAGDDEAGAQT